MLTKLAVPKPIDPVAAEIAKLPPEKGIPKGMLSPRAYALQVINDPEVPADRKDRMAIAMAAFFHTKLGELKHKAGAAEEAKPPSKFATAQRPLPGRLRAVAGRDFAPTSDPAEDDEHLFE